MKINHKKIYQVDSFTNQAFKGNPAGVMIVDESFGETKMQQLALEMNLSETAFVIPNDKNLRIRFFTPSVEVPLCGHATLASAHILYELGYFKPEEWIHFESQFGELVIRQDQGWITMNFPAYKIVEVDLQIDFKQLIGFIPAKCWKSDDDWFIALAKHELDIVNASPLFEQLIPNGLGHLMITAKSEKPHRDFVVRCFAPRSGINEDPVTGSAHCGLTPLWHQLTGKTQFVSEQLSNRGGLLKLNFLHNRVEISGQAVTIFNAELSM
jgi:PhzF family phenazine biosynthesis protein